MKSSPDTNFMPKSLVVLNVRILILFALIFSILTTAWIGDDAQITFRQVWNLISGYGITFNFTDRVQAFTHPLWFIVLSLFSIITQELFLTTIVISLFLSVGSVLMLMKIEYKSNVESQLIVSPIIALLFSWAFIDYTTSGLENSLTYFLIGLLLLQLSKDNWSEKLKFIFIIFALLVLNRMDYVILFFPLALYLLYKTGSIENAIRIILPGAVLLLLWTIFAIIYFGSPFPNTYFAKLNAGYPDEEIVIRGRHYFSLLTQDYGTLVIIIMGLLVASISRNIILILLSLGQIMYLYYIYSIGGDFMQGRFFSSLVFLSTGIIVFAFTINTKINKLIRNTILIQLIILTVTLSFFNNYPNLSYNFPFLSYISYTNNAINTKISDERSFYYKSFGLFSHQRRSWPVISKHPEVKPNSYRITCGFLGEISIQESSTIVIDICGLSDPLIARLPAIQNGVWSIGHHFRKMPTGYGEYLIGNSDSIDDENLDELLEDISVVVRGELFTLRRFGAIWRLNTNYYNNIDMDIYKDTTTYVAKANGTDQIFLASWDEIIKIELPALIFEHLGNFSTKEFISNVKIESEKPRLSNQINLSVDNQHTYEIFVNGELVSVLEHGRETWDAVVNLSQPMMVKIIEIKAVKADYFKISGPNALQYVNVLEFGG